MILESCALIVFVTSCLSQALQKATHLFHIALVHGGRFGVLHRLYPRAPPASHHEPYQGSQRGARPVPVLAVSSECLSS